MTEDEQKAFKEVTSASMPLNQLHPNKLDRWWKALVGAPDAIYMQMGCYEIFSQVDLAARAIKAMVDLLGMDSLPLPHREIAQRQIQTFRLHVARGEGSTEFTIRWNKETSSWEVTSDLVEDATKIVPSLEKANMVIPNWLVELEGQLLETAEES